MAQMCPTSSAQKVAVFYGDCYGVLHQECGPGSMSPRDRSIQLLSKALFKDIPFSACSWYLESVDHLITQLNGPVVSLYTGKPIKDQSSAPRIVPDEAEIQKKIAKLSEAHLTMLSKNEHVSRHSSSETVIASLYESAHRQIPRQHPADPCICQVD